MNSDELWRPAAAFSTLRQRARILRQIRDFFDERDVLEVETPALSHAASSEVHLQSMQVRGPGLFSGYLHTSPELAMKRLLAAGSGDIYQLCKVFRASEQGGLHNPEFTLLEWYRIDYAMRDLMQEVAELLSIVLSSQLRQASVYLTYRQAFLEYAQIDPFSASTTALQEVFEYATAQHLDGLSSNDYLDLILSFIVQPRLPRDRLVFITHFPAAQASLAKLAEDAVSACRFEVYVNGIELANGFEELTDYAEQQRRIEDELSRRRTLDLPNFPVDQHFLSALEAGLPACSGVALGVDRLVMLATGHRQIHQVMSFDFERA